MQIRYGTCTDVFVFSNVTRVLILPWEDDSHFTPVAGTVRAQGGETLKAAHDAGLSELTGNRQCARQVQTGIYLPSFVYDLTSRERRFKLHQLSPEACPAKPVTGRRKASEAMRTYVKELTAEKVLGLPVDQSEIPRKGSKKLLAKIEELENGRYEALFNFLGTELLEFDYVGYKDEEGRFSGYSEIQVAKKQTCYRGACRVPEVFRIFGHFVEGVLQGPVYLSFRGNAQTTVGVVKDGYFHGLVATFGLTPLLPHIVNERRAKTGHAYSFANEGLAMLARFVGGVPVKGEPVFRGMIALQDNPGFLYGVTEDTKSLNFTGDDVAYVYPNYESALVGRFEENVMKSARYSHVETYHCVNGVPRLTFREVTDRSLPSFEYDPPDNKTVSKTPLVRDPYEEELIEVRKSVEVTESNVPEEGVFAVKDLEADRFFGLYAGLQYDEEQHTEFQSSYCFLHAAGKNPCDKYAIGTHKGAMILLPGDLPDREVYRATSAYKINNAFGEDVTSQFIDVEHPRFGLIVGVSTVKPVKKDSEILINYGYSSGNTKGNHGWYFEQEKQYKEMQQRKEEMRASEEVSQHDNERDERGEAETDDILRALNSGGEKRRAWPKTEL